MCNANCVIFGVNNLTKEEVKGKKVIEAGSYDLNGSLRSIIKHWEPAEYIGVDIEEGSGVDIVCGVEDLIDKFGRESFDIVISTELFEHVKDWQAGISNLKNICKPEGIILITTRSHGFKYHSYPYDFWRYEIDDMKNIFSDFEILSLKKDRQDPGVFIKAKKPYKFIEKDLSDYRLYCIISNKRIKKITKEDYKSLNCIKLILGEKIKNFIKKLGNLL